MARRLLWLDLETTGLSSSENGIVQVAMLVENNKGKVVDKLNIRIKPFDGCVYAEEALKINGVTMGQIESYTPENEAMLQILQFLSKHLLENKSKFCIGGYNVRFDMDFLQALFVRNTDVTFDTFFTYYDLDVYSFVKFMDLWGKKIEGKGSKKLTAMCQKFDIDLEEKAHDAMADIKATRKLYKKLVKRYIK